jgi:hypothetical protein
VSRPKRPTPPPLSRTERQALEDLIRRGARALNPTEGNRLLRLLELDQGDRQQERRTAGGLMAQVQQLGGQLKDMTARAEVAEAALAALHEGEEPWGDDGAEPTPAQWLWCFNRVTPEERLELARCFQENEAAVDAMHEGEEPYEDERVVPTPGQWIWLWNRATSERRLDVAAQWRHMADTVDRCTAGLHNARIAELADLQRDWSTQRQQVARLTVDRDRLAHELRAAEDELGQRRRAAARGLSKLLDSSGSVDLVAEALQQQDRAIANATWNALLYGPVGDDGPSVKQASTCCRCGSAEVVYRNYRDQPFCCPCAECCPSPADDRAERYRLAWQSARGRAASAKEQLDVLESNEIWRSTWPLSVLSLWEPKHLGAAFGEEDQPWWAAEREEDRQRHLVRQHIADQLPVTPTPMAVPSEEQMRERVRQALGIVLKPNLTTPIDGQL